MVQAALHGEPGSNPGPNKPQSAIPGRLTLPPFYINPSGGRPAASGWPAGPEDAEAGTPAAAVHCTAYPARLPKLRACQQRCGAALSLCFWFEPPPGFFRITSTVTTIGCLIDGGCLGLAPGIQTGQLAAKVIQGCYRPTQLAIHPAVPALQGCAVVMA